MKYLLFIAVGGAGGAVARYLASNWVHSLWETRMPLGTLLVNLLGSALIGIIYVLIERQVVHPDWRGVLMVGFLGAFTTFSTFSLETIHLLEKGQLLLAAAYVTLSVLLCVLAAGGAIQLTRLFS
jgi:CrcB protein